MAYTSLISKDVCVFICFFWGYGVLEGCPRGFLYVFFFNSNYNVSIYDYCSNKNIDMYL